LGEWPTPNKYRYSCYRQYCCDKIVHRSRISPIGAFVRRQYGAQLL
jgi:hypothetical protein